MGRPAVLATAAHRDVAPVLGRSATLDRLGRRDDAAGVAKPRSGAGARVARGRTDCVLATARLLYLMGSWEGRRCWVCTLLPPPGRHTGRAAGFLLLKPLAGSTMRWPWHNWHVYSKGELSKPHRPQLQRPGSSCESARPSSRCVRYGMKSVLCAALRHRRCCMTPAARPAIFERDSTAHTSVKRSL